MKLSKYGSEDILGALIQIYKDTEKYNQYTFHASFESFFETSLSSLLVTSKWKILEYNEQMNKQYINENLADDEFILVKKIVMTIVVINNPAPDELFIIE
jgi:hypothetical protein